MGVANRANTPRVCIEDSRVERTGDFGCAVFEALPFPVLILDADGTIIAVNEGWRRFQRDRGWKNGAGDVGDCYLRVLRYHAARREQAADAIAAGLAAVGAGTSDLFEWTCGWPPRGDAPAGEVDLCFRIHAVPLPTVVSSRRLLISHLDVTTECVQLSRARTRARLFGTVFAEASDAMILADDEGRYVEVNKATEDLIGLPAHELLGRRLEEISAGGIDAAHSSRALLRMGRTAGVFELVRPDGNIRDVEFSSIADVAPGRHLSVLRDVTARNAAEVDRRIMEARLLGLFESAVVNVTFANETGHIFDANDAFLQTIGRTRDEFRAGLIRWTDLTPPEFLDVNRRAHQEVKRTGRCTPFEKQYVRPDGSRVWVLIGLSRVPGRPGETVALSIDITRAKELEVQFHQNQKLDALGRLAGSVAHDFNNLLCAIIGYAELASAHAALPPAAGADLAEVLRAARSAAGLTGQLLAFSRRAPAEPKRVQLNEVVSGIAGILQRLAGPDVVLGLNLAPKLPGVFIDPGQLEQVVLNLVVNARDAMPHGGELTIETAQDALADVPAGDLGQFTSDASVVLRVRDTGTGMSAAVRERLFEPFFTTKEEGKGSGIGLATVYRIIDQAGGHIRVDSTPGVGSLFTIHLPVAKETGELGAPPRCS